MTSGSRTGTTLPQPGTPAEPAEPLQGGVTYISWAESCSRSDHTARELGGRSHMAYAPQYGSRPSTILFKYLAQWRETARILRAERPEVVFVMTPLVAALPAFWYAWRRGQRVVLDAHTGAFLNRLWRHLLWLQRRMCRRATITIVHNEHMARLTRAAGGPVPDVQFYATGNPRRLPASLTARRPGNVRLTGFLSTAAYGGLLTSADAVMTLTTNDHTMLRGAYEAIYQGTPVIVSDWPILRQSFSEGAIHVDNTPEDIAAAVRTMQRQHEVYRAGAVRLRAHKLQIWHHTRQAILERIGGPASTTDSSGSRY